MAYVIETPVGSVRIVTREVRVPDLNGSGDRGAWVARWQGRTVQADTEAEAFVKLVVLIVMTRYPLARFRTWVVSVAQLLR